MHLLELYMDFALHYLTFIDDNETRREMSEKETILMLSKALMKELLENPTPELEKCCEILQALHDIAMTPSLLDSTGIKAAVQGSWKSLKRHKRTSDDSSSRIKWDSAIEQAKQLVKKWETMVEIESKKQGEITNSELPTMEDSTQPGPARTVSEYRARLVRQKKELFKDPPVLPPREIETESIKCPLPKRNSRTGVLTFTATDPQVQNLLKDFQPNRSPEDVLRAGSFGGTYFRSIVSAVTNVRYNAKDVLRETVPEEWIEGLPLNMLTSSVYRPQINKYGVKCGGSLGMWESSGWITHVDPYGWFQWYCWFYQGRRCTDDARQISRWLKSAGPKGRFRSQLCNKILAAKASHDNASISPVIRQTLLHWGLEITEEILNKHRKRVG